MWGVYQRNLSDRRFYRKKIEMTVIVGGGAGGLLTSIILAKSGKKVKLLEKDYKLARKLRTTGNGRCNITNLDISPAFYHSNNPELIGDFLLGYEEIEKEFLKIGVPFRALEDARVFPMSFEANALADILEYEALKAGVEIVKECEVFDIEEGFVLKTSKGDMKAGRLILATGTKAGRTGGSSKGAEICRKFGHTVYKYYPSLVQLETEENFKKCAGVKIRASLSLYSNGKFIKETKGDLLFTDYGISGLAVLDISPGIAKRLEDYEYLEIKADFFPEMSKNSLKKFLNSLDFGKDPLVFLKGILPSKLAALVLERIKLKNGKFTQKELNSLVYILKNFEITVKGVRDYKYAEVMSGGVSIAEVNSRTMESKKVKNLHIIGEMLDVDGERGGYNLHFAWSCAIKLKNIKECK